MNNPRTRALSATILFALFGVTDIALFVTHWIYALPFIIFYVLLVYNTYCSINYFSGIIPPDLPSQQWIDAALVIIYFLIAASLTHPFFFGVALVALFIVAAMKYVLALPLISSPKLLHRKIVIDLLGGLASMLYLIGAALDHAWLVMTLWTLMFFFANIYLLYLKPLYSKPLETMVKDKHHEPRQ